MKRKSCWNCEFMQILYGEGNCTQGVLTDSFIIYKQYTRSYLKRHKVCYNYLKRSQKEMNKIDSIYKNHLPNNS